MSTLNGFGTLYYGWRHASDGTATATKWFAISWLPVIPIERHHLRVLTDFSNQKQSIKSELGGFVVSQTDHYQILEKTPISAKEVGVTYAKAYVGLPSMLFGPMLAVILLMGAIKAFGIEVRPETPAFNVFLVGVFLAFANFLYQSVKAIRRARGWQPKIK